MKAEQKKKEWQRNSIKIVDRTIMRLDNCLMLPSVVEHKTNIVCKHNLGVKFKEVYIKLKYNQFRYWIILVKNMNSVLFKLFVLNYDLTLFRFRYAIE